MEGFTITKKKVQALAFYKVYESCLKGIDSTANLCPNVWKRRLDRMEYPILTEKNNWGVRYIIGTILLLDGRPGIAIPLWCRHKPQQGTVEHNLTRYPPWSACGGLTDQSEFGNHHCNDVQEFKKSWASFHQNGPCGILTIFSTYIWLFLWTCAFFVAQKLLVSTGKMLGITEFFYQRMAASGCVCHGGRHRIGLLNGKRCKPRRRTMTGRGL